MPLCMLQGIGTESGARHLGSCYYSVFSKDGEMSEVKLVFECLTSLGCYLPAVVTAVNIAAATLRVNPWHMQMMQLMLGSVGERLAF